ncbi:50S ribosomal protein L29 [Candidatus Roizmanbacteria bacterium RIFCSPHIGHO2_12_FULL_33_9]|uniref:Large ribosomal subunit protein uL29 n=1 Tax=Candidatus Roizmanbacteria bacterium RIFCSPHIGHO2_12_FULL_33_9 TaxID=1802045 RepID=A0A1F7HKB9_9BACT|nr:MAG: 50S ribosomal protein L29 [Candidatus Roizmanbacteria bacterium RIFCSPHIGHO2_12_FULL_33_9]
MKKYATEFRKKTVKELEKESKDIKNEIEKLKIDWVVNKPENTNVISSKQKKLSVLLTVLSEKKELENLAPTSLKELRGVKDK